MLVAWWNVLESGEMGPIIKEKFLVCSHVYIKMPKPPAVTIAEGKPSFQLSCGTHTAGGDKSRRLN